MPPSLKIGEAAPSFSLKGVDEKIHALSDAKAAKAAVVIFSCNHCPYVQAYEERMVALAHEFEEKGVAFFVINANDDDNYPEDSFAEMKKRAKARSFPFPYLRDESQDVAAQYGAQVTPDCFVFDAKRRLVYRGRIDDNWKDPARVRDQSLRNALLDVLAGRPLEEPEKQAIGCSIKWKTED